MTFRFTTFVRPFANSICTVAPGVLPTGYIHWIVGHMLQRRNKFYFIWISGQLDLERQTKNSNFMDSCCRRN